jgi:hypothetical protein
MRERDTLIHPPPTTREATPPVDAVRAFVFLAGLRWMREHGYEERCNRLLEVRFHDMANTVAASDWVPLADALSIYTALDEMMLTFAEQIDIGRYVAMANNGVIVSTVARLAGKLGLSPWAILGRLHGVWLRNNRGGAVAVYRVDDRSARIEFWGVPFATSDFFRTSLCGSMAAGLEPFAEHVRVVEMPEHRDHDAFALRASW